MYTIAVLEPGYADYGTEREPDNARDDDCCQADPQRETNDLKEIAVASRYEVKGFGESGRKLLHHEIPR